MRFTDMVMWQPNLNFRQFNLQYAGMRPRCKGTGWKMVEALEGLCNSLIQPLCTLVDDESMTMSRGHDMGDDWQRREL